MEQITRGFEIDGKLYGWKNDKLYRLYAVKPIDKQINVIKEIKIQDNNNTRCYYVGSPLRRIAYNRLDLATEVFKKPFIYKKEI